MINKICLFLTIAFLAKGSEGGTIVQELTNYNLSRLIELVQKADLLDALAQSTPLTLFAPTNEAFEQLEEKLGASLDDLDIEVLRNVLLSHVVPGNTIFFNDLEEDQVVQTAGPNGEMIRANVYLRSKFYHGYLTVNGKRVSVADLRADTDQSVIHILTEVLFPLVAPEDTILARLAGDSRFGSLLSALDKAGLVDVFDQPEGTFTLFAPTDDAFAKLGDETIKALLGPETSPEALGSILKRHVVATAPVLFRRGISWDFHDTIGDNGEMLATQVFKLGTIRVINENKTRAALDDEEIVASNGVIHPIDTVI